MYSLTVFCTCSEACSVRIDNNVKPTHLIIDEAAMTTEPEAMIPIQLADHITLIGDHKQLQVCVCAYVCCGGILCVHVFSICACVYVNILCVSVGVFV